jgi:hypothetical protein
VNINFKKMHLHLQKVMKKGMILLKNP